MRPSVGPDRLKKPDHNLMKTSALTEDLGSRATAASDTPIAASPNKDAIRSLKQSAQLRFAENTTVGAHTTVDTREDGGRLHDIIARPAAKLEVAQVEEASR